jgi:protein associated with RNAse G/E
MSSIIVRKLNFLGEEMWRYRGEVLERRDDSLILKATFDLDDIDICGMSLCRGDHFFEWYYSNRWYNIHEIYNRDDNSLRGWYCNIATPAQFDEEFVVFQDLALDLLVFPDGCQIVLDEDEFEALTISPEIREKALKALKVLQNIFKEKESSGKSNTLGFLY